MRRLGLDSLDWGGTFPEVAGAMLFSLVVFLSLRVWKTSCGQKPLTFSENRGASRASNVLLLQVDMSSKGSSFQNIPLIEFVWQRVGLTLMAYP